MISNKILFSSKSWNEFKSSLQILNNKDKGDCFEQLVYYYLQLHPNYATKLKHVWLFRDISSAIVAKLSLPEQDEGIDLVAETKDGEYWAIQCKYRDDEEKTLTRRELSTFTDLAFGICKGFSLALVCSTVDRFSHKLKQYGDRISFCAGDVWRDLDEDFFVRSHGHLRGKIALPKSRIPRHHQKRAIINAYKHFVENNERRGKLIMPCGTGKSLAAFWIAERLKAKTVLIAVPSLALIRQTLAVWARESFASKKNINWICVCSDVTVGDMSNEDVAVLTQDLGVKIHTNPNEVANWLKRKYNGLTVIMTTYQSGKMISEASRSSNTVFDLGIMDEAHKTVGKKGSLFSHLLFEKNIRIKKRIFMTATERCYLGKSDHIASMDDLEIYGDTFELLSFKSALEYKPPILSDYKIVTVLINKSEIADLIEKNLYVKPDKGSWDDDIEAEMLAAAIALRKAIATRPIKHAVSFHASIARAKAFKNTQDILTKIFPEYKNLETFHVTGATPTSIRKKEVDKFENATRSLITNARCLTEGVDVPNIDCVLFADPKRSTIDIVQAVGRALRPAPGKKMGYIIVPVLLEDEVKNDDIIQSNVFDNVLTTLRALAANDDRIIEHFRSVSQGRKLGKGTSPVEIALPVGIKIDADEFIKAVEIKYWSRLAKLSWRPFEEARDFVHTLGIKGQTEWFKYCKGLIVKKESLPEDIPTCPNKSYLKKGWKNWGDWLGTFRVADQLKSFRKYSLAKKYIHKLKLRNQNDWRRYCRGEMLEKGKLPANIPSHPDNTYQNNGWKDWGDWLGTNFIAYGMRKYKTYNEARLYVNKIKLKSIKEWYQFCDGEIANKGKLPNNIPKAPEYFYRDKGWANWSDWLNTNERLVRKRKFREFILARKFVRSLKLKSTAEWFKYSKGMSQKRGKLPKDIPINASRTYRNKGWVSWSDWLGNNNVATRLRKYRSFHEARLYVRNLGLKSKEEWDKYCKNIMPKKGRLPVDIPVGASRTYKNSGWTNWSDWLGVTNGVD